MKRIISVILTLFLVLGVFVTPAFAAVGDNSFTEYESNDSTSTADRIYNDYTVSGTLSSKYDMDMFKFTLSSSSKVSFLCMSARSVVMVGIADSAGDIIDAAYLYYDDGYYWNTYSDTLPAGTYYIVILEDQDYSYTNVSYMFYFEYESAAHTHSYSSSVVSPTCTQQGYTVYTCSCGYSYNGNYTSARGHNYGLWTTVIEATCDYTGTKKRVCNTCGYSETATIAASHTVSDWIVDEEATCSTTGSQHKECTICGKIIETQTIEVSHTIGDWITDKTATVYRAGSKHKECTVCGEVLETVTIPQLKCSKPALKKVYNVNDYVKVTWGTVKGADLYRVYRKTGTGEYEYIGSTKNTYFNDEEAGAGKTCRYIVKAKNEAGFSDYSTSLAIKHIDEPTLKSTANSANGVLIKWNKVTGAQKYNVYRKVSGGEYECIGATANTYYTDKIAKSGTKYYYAIRAKSDDSISSQSASLSKYYLEDPTLNTPSSTSKGVGLKWSKVTGAEGYMVYRRTTDGSYKLLTTEEGVSNLSYRDTTAKKGTKYYYKVKAYKSKTYSAYSNTKSITDKY